MIELWVRDNGKVDISIAIAHNFFKTLNDFVIRPRVSENLYAVLKGEKRTVALADIKSIKSGLCMVSEYLMPKRDIEAKNRDHDNKRQAIKRFHRILSFGNF